MHHGDNQHFASQRRQSGINALCTVGAKATILERERRLANVKSWHIYVGNSVVQRCNGVSKVANLGMDQ